MTQRRGNLPEGLVTDDLQVIAWFWVDVPNPGRTSDDDSWVNVGEFTSRSEAEEFLSDRYGIEAEHASIFITEGEA